MKNEVLTDEMQAALDQEYTLQPPTRYNAISRLLARVRISHRIYALVALCLIMLCSTMTIQHFGNVSIRTTEQNAERLRSLSNDIMQVELMLSRMEVANIDFYNAPTASENEFHTARKQALQKVAITQNQSSHHQTDLSAVEASLRLLGSAFSESKSARLTIGLSDKDGLRGTLKTASNVIETELEVWPNVSSIKAIMTRLHRFEQSFLVTSSKKDAGKIRKSLSELDFAISGGPFGADTRQKLSEAVQTYGRAIKSYVKAIKARAEAEADFTNSMATTRNQTQTLIAKAAQELQTAIAHTQYVREATTRTQNALIAVGTVLFAVLAFVIANSIHRPISNIRTAMNLIAAGDSTIRVPGLSRRDEIGAMARSIALFKHTALEIEHIRVQEQQSKENAELRRKETLRALADNFENTVRRVAQSVQSSAQEISDNAITLSRDAQSTQSQGDHMAHSIETAAEIMGRVVESSEQLLQATASVDTRLNASSQSISRATQGAQSITERIQALSNAANGIGSVVNLINEIAEKTNLLALNATIEAARAGDAGKGFAVVAGEVKQLAQQTQSATSNIAEQVRLIQADISETVSAITSVCQNIEDMQHLTANLNAAVREQTTATSEIKAQVSHAASGTKDVSNNLMSMKVAIKTSSASAHGVVMTVDALNQQSQRLEKELDAFIHSINAL